MIKKFQNLSGKLTYEEALRQAGERVESQTRPSIQVKGVNNSNRRVPNVRERAKGRARIRNREKEEQIQRFNQQNEMHALVPSGKHYDPVADEDVTDYENHYSPKIIGMSGADPLMEFYVGGEALGPLFKLLGKGALYTLGRYYRGTNYGDWAAAKLIAPEMNRALVNNSQKLIPSLSQYISLTQQPIKQNESGLTSLKFFERPSKITEAERLGIPKGERNLTVSKRDYPVGTAQQYVRKGAIARMDDNSRYASEMFKKGDFEKVHSDETIRIPDKFSPNGYQLHAKTRRNYYFSEADPYANNRLKGNWKNIMEYNDREGDILGKDLPKEFYDYLEQIKDTEIYPNFTNLKSKDVIYPYKRITLFGSKTGELKANEIQSKYVRDFRQYLGHLGYNTSNISDHQILQLLTDQYKMLTKSMNGKTKGQIFWHEGPKYNEVFDFSHTGENTGNMGALGPGNYFSSGASAYGKVSQPYLITGIKETPIASQSMIDKGLIPEYISPSQSGINIRGGSRYFEYLHASPEEKLKYPQDLRELYENALAKAKERVATTPVESSRLWIDPALIKNSGVAPRLSLIKVKPMEFMLRRNTGIKSLFPHPSTFTRDADGRIVINRIWEDPRVNYKQGGKMI